MLAARRSPWAWILVAAAALICIGSPEIARSKTPKSPPAHPAVHAALLAAFRNGPLAATSDIVFAVRKVVGEHWYANFSYYANDREPSHFGNGNKLYRDGARLCRLNLDTRRLTVLLDDPQGGVRDPQVHYDGGKIIFSYRKGGSENYHLYEIHSDGFGLRQLTDGPYDDIEPSYLPDGHIVFVSSRCRRWVNCWLTQVAVLHRCDADGRNIRELSSNNEHDNTPWPLPNGQILYTRWEYVDRNQVSFHHLWVATPDGLQQTIFYGNEKPGTVMIDAKPIPGSGKVVVSFSPGHGRPEHEGQITVLDPRQGPDNPRAARIITQNTDYRDPWAFSEEAFLAAHGAQIVLVDGQGRIDPIYELPAADRAAGLQCHEPRPLTARPRENVIAPNADWNTPTGQMLVVDVHDGRNMEGVRPGEIKKLLVLETLPKPINFTGGMEPLSYGGTFTLERILGTIPVEPDGSAYAEIPALRSVFFVALDEHDLSVKRMQSFTSVMPGETRTCIGCHEHRVLAPDYKSGDCLAFRRHPSRIEPIADAPEVFDFPRDVQPVLDRHCVRCHNADKPEGNIVLSGDHGPMFSLSYYTITAHSLVADGRNSMGNHPPRTIGSSASRLLALMDGAHYGANPGPHDRKMVRLWIDSGAPYPGTYAALGCGMVGGYAQNRLDRSDLDWKSTQAAMAAIRQRCGTCHQGTTALPLTVSDEVGGPPWVGLSPNDIRRRLSRHIVYDLTRPEKSMILLAPLAKAAGGHEACGKAVLAGTADPDYQKILAAIEDARRKLDQIKRFDMPGFRPRPEYVREMRRYGILPAAAADTPIDPYALERQYWQSLWYRK